MFKQGAGDDVEHQCVFKQGAGDDAYISVCLNKVLVMTFTSVYV